jgi:hypothetical protein
VEFLSRIDLILEPSAHDLLPHLLNTLDKQLLEIIALDLRIRLLRDQLPVYAAILVDHVLELADELIVVGLERLHVFYYVVFDVLS